jgi:hypothetical protein
MKKYAIALLILCFAAFVCMPISTASDDGDDDYYDHIYAPPTTKEKEIFAININLIKKENIYSKLYLIKH